MLELYKRQQFLYNRKCKLLNSLHEYPEWDNQGRAKVITEWELVKAELAQIALDFQFYQKQGYLPTKEVKAQKEANVQDTRLKIKEIQTKIALKNARAKKSLKESTRMRNEEEIVQLRLEEKGLKNKLKLMNA